MSESSPRAPAGPETPEVNELLVYIGGSGRSGSTLLDLLLNNNPYVQSTGEIHRLNHYARENTEACTCGEPVASCPFWLEVEQEFIRQNGTGEASPLKHHEMMLIPEAVPAAAGLLQKAVLGTSWKGLHDALLPRIGPAHAEAARNSTLWYAAIRKVSGAPIIVDSTKDARRLKTLYFSDPARYRLIYMVRDGRAVAASAMRRDGVTMDTAAKDWASAIRRSEWAQRGIPPGQRAVLVYEELCREPERELRRICSFLGVPFSAQMLELRKQESHNIGGNPMRFRTGEQTIRLDERWREQLSADDLAIFDRRAGTWNRRLGYST